MNNGLKILGTVVVTLSSFVWYAHARPQLERPQSAITSLKAQIPPVQAHHEEAIPNFRLSATPAVAEDMTTRFKHATDYAEFAHGIRAEAEAGDSAAQYYLEESLRYCDQNLTRYFGLTGTRPRTLDEAQARWARKGPGNHPEMMQQEIIEVYAHCRAFLEDSAVRPEMKAWTYWLDQAAENGYPPAEIGKAQVLWGDYVMAQYSMDPAPTTPVDPSAPEKVHELVLNALQSGDATVLWQSADLVGIDHPRELTDESAMVPLAWRLLACERGFDCSASAEWLRVACNQGPTCTPGETVPQMLEQTAIALGGNWEDVKRLAGEIGATVDAKDEAKLPSYLWATT